MNFFLFLSACFLLMFLVGLLIEKARVPWIFSALLIGAVLAIYNPFPEILKTESMELLSDLGMYSLLFIIGLEIDLAEIRKLGRVIAKTTVLVIALETLFGTFFVHTVFGTDWKVAALVAMSFGTVGEAILVPILDEFKIMHTRMGQAILGVATLDDIVELAALIWLSVLLGTSGSNTSQIETEFFGFFLLIGLTGLLFVLKKKIPKIQIPNYNGIVIGFMLVVLFGYIGIGAWSGMEALAAILAGLITKYFLSEEQFKTLETYTKLLTYGFLAPIFLLKVGSEMNMNYLLSSFWLVLFITLISSFAKLLGSWISNRKEFGQQKAILMGIGLSVRFSTSIVIVSMLYQNDLIGSHLFSVLIASSILFISIIPPLFANLLVKWGVAFKPE